MGKYWFKQKTFGYGAGFPVAWQGWVAFAAYLCAVGGLVTVFRDQVSWGVTGILIVTLPFLLLCRAKTEGGWLWRWGGKP